MPRWIIGDVQGCFRELTALLETIAWDPAADEVWLAGDLVNRGRQSLAVLRWARSQGDRVKMVLGNHDLHLIGRALGLRRARKRDTLEPILAAPDRDELIAWLRSRPLLIRDGDVLMVHAALHPKWSVKQATRLARKLERMLQGPEAGALVGDMSFKFPLTWAEATADEALRMRFALAMFTRARCFDHSGRARWDYTGTLDDAPGDRIPWFRVPHVRPADGPKIFFGHWAALGHHVEPGFEAIDTGCVWGNALMAVCVDDGRVVSVPALL